MLVFEDDVLRLICGYSLQSVRGLKEKQCYDDELKSEWDMHGVNGLAVCLGGFDGHVGLK